MSFLEEVRAKRQKLAAVLVDEDYSGIREIVEDLYPDRAHFLFELLQNAEDAGATEAVFHLHADLLAFEHDGHSFNEANVWAITNIGKGTKKFQEDQIGCFGVGFKAVFAYSETPHIWSPTYSFKITDFVLPTEIKKKDDLGKRTRFEFPFNNPKKQVADAFEEVVEGLNNLAETSLLFLSHLEQIKWQIDQNAYGTIRRLAHSEHHFEVQKQSNGRTTGSCHFLKFDRPVARLEKQRVAVAYALDFLPSFQTFDAKKPLAEQMKIIPATAGRVAVFFPAEKETSGLHFHLHAPFVPELSRASIKQTPANLPLLDQLADLAASSLHTIRDLGLLTPDFLRTLPNPQDSIPERYQGIRSVIVVAMNSQPLTPTYEKSHAPAKHLLQANAALKSLLNEADLEFLVDHEGEPPQWAISASQKSSNLDRFLESLAIQKWGIDDFVQLLRNKTARTPESGSCSRINSKQVGRWLSKKSVEWHQEFYALLQSEYLSERKWINARLDSIEIILLTDGSYGVGTESYFVGDVVEHDEVLRRVDPRVYTTGKNKAQKENAKGFLEKIGVREVGEAELVEAILERRYRSKAAIPDERTYGRDLKRFIDLVEEEPEAANLFAESFIFKCSDNIWRRAGQVYLDQPISNTGLSAYYLSLGSKADRVGLNDCYQSCGVSAHRLTKFALTIGVAGSLVVQTTTCQSNPDQRLLRWERRLNNNRYRVDIDYYIPAMDSLLETRNVALSQLVWTTLCNQKDDSWATAQYRGSSNEALRSAPSQLVCVLRARAWVPQTGGKFVRPSEANRDFLPAGFTFDPGWTWLQTVQFGQNLAKKSPDEIQRQTLAKQLGFDDEDALDRAKRFTALPADEQHRFLADRERKTPVELPDQEPANPSRRADRMAAQAADAPERLVEDRMRSVSVGLDAVKEEAGQYLRQQYTSLDGQMICQVCKSRLPFKLDNGSDYFERVEFLRGLKRRHQQNYVALCPNHAAMFQHANGSTDKLRDLLVELTGNEMKVMLAREETTIYFTMTHLADLRAIIGAAQSELKSTNNVPHAVTGHLGLAEPLKLNQAKQK
jgi:hypothetical protein